MNLQSSEQAIVNAIYAAIAWLALDFGLLYLEHGKQTLSILVSRPEMAAGAVITIACIAGLFYKSRFAAIVLFLIFLLPLILRAVQGILPSAIFLIFSLILLYFFLTAVLGTFSYHHLKTAARNTKTPD
jgi:K+-sensing histidine kinase KdpD